MSDSADAGAAGPAAAAAEVVPAPLAARWDQASGRLFGPLLMDPEQYQVVVLVLAEVLDQLREQAPSTAALLAVSGRAPQLAAEGLQRADPDPLVLAGVDPELLGMAALAQRHRELRTLEVARHRVAVLGQARAGLAGWTVLEESGDPEGDPYHPYRRLEADPRSGRAILVRCDPDEDLTGCEHRAEPAQVDLQTGELRMAPDAGEAPPLPDAAAREACASRLRDPADTG